MVFDSHVILSLEQQQLGTAVEHQDVLSCFSVTNAHHGVLHLVFKDIDAEMLRVSLTLTQQWCMCV